MKNQNFFEMSDLSKEVVYILEIMMKKIRIEIDCNNQFMIA